MKDLDKRTKDEIIFRKEITRLKTAKRNVGRP